MSLSQQQQERQAALAAASIPTVANIIDDDEDSTFSDDHYNEIYIPPATGRRSRANSLDDMIMGPPGSNVHMIRQELSFCRGNALSPLPVVSESEDAHQDQEEASTTAAAVAAARRISSSSSNVAVPTMTKTATFTNLDVVHRDNTDRKRKARDFVSVDQSFVSELLDEEQHEHEHEHDSNDAPEDTNKNNGNDDDDVDIDAEYYKVAAERACSIVDFVFAGDEIFPSSTKRLRFE